MERIRAEKNTDYTVINNTCLKDKRLSLKAKGFFALVMSLPETWDFSINGMVAISKEGKTAIYGAIKELMETGYCVRTYLYEAGKRVGVDYLFKENLNKENLNKENLNKENQPQLSKEDNKVKKEKETASPKNLDLTEKKEQARAESETFSIELLEIRKEDFFKMLKPFEQPNKDIAIKLGITVENLLQSYWIKRGQFVDGKNHKVQWYRRGLDMFVEDTLKEISILKEKENKSKNNAPPEQPQRQQPSQKVLETNERNQRLRDESFLNPAHLRPGYIPK